MAFFEHVERGAAYRPRADLENAMCDLLNRRNGFVEHSMRGNENSQLRIAVYNAGASTILYGAPVEINADATSVEGILPVKSATETATTWGIALATMDCGESGDTLVVGVTQIRGITGTAKEFVVPDGGGGFVYSDGGICRVLRALDESSAMVLLGLSTAQDDDTFFKLSHRVELIESGGVQVETRFADLSNPGNVFAFGSSAALLASSIPVSAGSIYLQYSASGGVELTQKQKYGTLYPGVRMGSVNNSSIVQGFVTHESELKLNDCTPFYRSQPLCKPIISGGSAVTLVLPMVTDIRRTDNIDYPNDLVTISSAVLLQSDGDLYASATYDSATHVFSADYVRVPPDGAAPSGMTVYIGQIGNDLGYRGNRVTFGGEYYIK